LASKLLDAAPPEVLPWDAPSPRATGLPLGVWFCIICTQKALTDWEEGREEIPDRESCRRRDGKGFIAQGSRGRVCAFATGLWWEECILRRGQPTRQLGVVRSRLNTRLSPTNTISCARLLVCSWRPTQNEFYGAQREYEPVEWPSCSASLVLEKLDPVPQIITLQAPP
ncbi:mCG141836, partial [Mus musculus]